jgi:prepilin-type N-terminal cleavage/methylation domain-containing protein
MNKTIKRKAFTLVEMVMVIVILGIVGMIGSDIIAKMYQGYIKSKITNDLQQKTELVIEQIVRRFGQRMKDTTIARQIDVVNSMIDYNATALALGNHNMYKKLNDPDINKGGFNPNAVEWIGYDNESYIGKIPVGGSYSIPGWSGFVDVKNSHGANPGATISMPGSDLSYARDVIFALSNSKTPTGATSGRIDMDTAVAPGQQHPILLSKCIDNSNMDIFGWKINGGPSGGDSAETIIVNRHGFAIGDNTHLNLDSPSSRKLCEQYYLAWTAYALIPVPNVNKANDFNLTLKYNYQPWHGEDYNSTTTSSALLAEHVSTFRVMQVGDSVRVKVCIHDSNITGTQYTFCKEKAIF